MLTSNIWQVYNTNTICCILSLSDRAPLWKMARKKVRNISMKNEVYQFQVACVSYMSLRQNNAFKYQIDNCMSHQSDENNHQV